MEEESRQKTDRKRMLGLLTVSCAATLCFAGLYVQELKTVEKLESAGQWTDTEELNALRADYSAAISRAELAEQEQEERTQVNDLITAFLNAYFLLPDSREALLSGCEEYVSEDAWRTIELLSDSRDYNEAERELFYYQGDCTELEDGNLYFLMNAPEVMALAFPSWLCKHRNIPVWICLLH